MTTQPPRIPTQFVSPDAETAAQFPPIRHDRPDDDAPERDAEAVEATPAAPAPPAGAPPEPLYAGTYAVYDDQAGGLLLVVGTREGQTHRKHLPARMLKMAEKFGGGNNPLSALFGG